MALACSFQHDQHQVTMTCNNDDDDDDDSNGHDEDEDDDGDGDDDDDDDEGIKGRGRSFSSRFYLWECGHHRLTLSSRPGPAAGHCCQQHFIMNYDALH